MAGVPFPTDVTYFMDFDDGTVTENRDFEFAGDPLKNTELVVGGRTLPYVHYMSVSHPLGYRIGATYNTSMSMWNLVNYVNLTFEHFVYETIYDVNDFIYWTEQDGNDTIYYPGFWEEQDHYPIENQLFFNVSQVFGSHLTYFYDFGDGETSTKYMDSVAEHWYNDTGAYDTFVNISNPRDTWLSDKTIYIQRSVGNTSISTMTPAARNQTFDIEVDFGALGTHVCCMIDFVDEEGDDNRYYFIGHEVRCREIHPDEWESFTDDKPRRFMQYSTTEMERQRDEEDSANKTVQFTFQSIAVNYMTLNCSNRVSRNVHVWKTVVTKGPCWYPTVDLEDRNPCRGTCDERFPHMLAVLRSSSFTIHSNVSINCTSTKEASYAWSAFTVHPDTFEETPLENLTGAITADTINSTGKMTLIVYHIVDC